MAIRGVGKLRREGVKSMKLGIPRIVEQDSQFPFVMDESVSVQIAVSKGEPCLIIRRLTEERAREAGAEVYLNDIKPLNLQQALINRKRIINKADNKRTHQQQA